jgi:hypothetical protein
MSIIPKLTFVINSCLIFSKITFVVSPIPAISILYIGTNSPVLLNISTLKDIVPVFILYVFNSFFEESSFVTFFSLVGFFLATGTFFKIFLVDFFLLDTIFTPLFFVKPLITL